MKLEDKIASKAKAIFEAYLFRDSGVGASSKNKEQFVIDMVGAMLKIIKAEVNIRLQTERHKK